MIIFPIVAAAISGVFATALFRQFSARRRLQQLAWGIALVQFAIASLAVAAGLSGGWDPTLYRVFWLFGALLNVPWLALGSIALVSKRPAGVVATGIVSIMTVYAVIAVAGATPTRAALDAAVEMVPRGSDAWSSEPSMTALARWYSIVAWLIVVGIAAWSSKPRKGVRPPVDRVRANWLIAIGVTIVAAGGFGLGRALRGTAAAATFSISLALGVAVMFAGFLLASRAPRYRVEDPGESTT